MTDHPEQRTNKEYCSLFSGYLKPDNSIYVCGQNDIHVIDNYYWLFCLPFCLYACASAYIPCYIVYTYTHRKNNMYTYIIYTYIFWNAHTYCQQWRNLCFAVWRTSTCRFAMVIFEHTMYWRRRNTNAKLCRINLLISVLSATVAHTEKKWINLECSIRNYAVVFYSFECHQKVYKRFMCISVCYMNRMDIEYIASQYYCYYYSLWKPSSQYLEIVSNRFIYTYANCCCGSQMNLRHC